MGVYRRTDWNSIIQQVNDLCENPPEATDCDPLATLEEVDANHIWVKGDIQQVRDKLTEICDENVFAETLDYWKQATIDEINEAIVNGWCGCEPECVSDCSNAVDENPVISYLGSFNQSACHNCGAPPDCPGCPATCLYADRLAAQMKGGEASSASSDWADLWVEYCDLVKAVEDLEVIRDNECAQPPPNNCAAAQAAVDAKQAERDAKLEAANAKEAEADAAAAESMTLADAVGPPDAQHYYSGDAGSEPWADTACNQLAPECLGREPQRCRVWWSVQTKVHQYMPLGEWHGAWSTMMTGGYTPSGQPFISSISTCGGISAYACQACGPGACASGCYGTTYVIELRLVQLFPNTTLEGETCC